MFRARDAQGGPVALVAGVQQATQVLVALGRLGGAEQCVGLVDEERGRILGGDRAEDRRRAGIDRDQRCMHGLGHHIEQPRLAAPLRRPHHRQTRRMLPRGLYVGGRHPQGHRSEGLLARHHDEPLDPGPQVSQYLRPLGHRHDVGSVVADLVGGRRGVSWLLVGCGSRWPRRGAVGREGWRIRLRIGHTWHQLLCSRAIRDGNPGHAGRSLGMAVERFALGPR